MAVLDPSGTKILAYLVEILPNIKADRPNEMPGYKHIHDALQLPPRSQNFGDSLKLNGLSNLADWTHAEGHPAITGIIVNQTPKSDHYLSPGGGYFRLFGRPEGDGDWWREEIEKAKAYDWSPWVGTAVTPRKKVKPPPKANDINAPAGREIVSISRIIRDTKMSLYAKQLHNFCCQICGHSIMLGKGQKYAEAHHLKPLGQPHNGPDILANIVCLCPNHHAELDYRIASIARQDFRPAEGHDIAEEFIEYHNENLRDVTR